MRHILGFYDSGIGGLPYLQWIRSHFTGCSYKYLAESRYFPLGTKDEETIKKIVVSSIGRFIDKVSPDAIVIACNTASVTALEILRQTYSIPFVGVVPAVKPAALMSKTKKIGLFATNKTVSQLYTQKLISDFASDCQVVKFAMPEIVSFVENELMDSTSQGIEEKIKPAATFFQQNNVDTVILGCTHFVYLEEMFKKLLGTGINVIDSREGVGRHAIDVISKLPVHLGNCLTKDEFFVTSSEKMPKIYKKVYNKFCLAYGGEI